MNDNDKINKLKISLHKLNSMIVEWANDQGFPKENSACWQLVQEMLNEVNKNG